MPRSRLVAWSALLAGCQPAGGERAVPSCDGARPAAADVVVRSADCDGMSLAWGEGRPQDVWVANHRFRAVLRHPEGSLTLPGVGGGTVVDAGPWGVGDALHEAVPLVGGGWLSPTEAILHADGWTLRGTVRSLPDQPAAAEGLEAEVTWRVHPDDPWLAMEGADGLWLHAARHLVPVDGWLWSDAQVYGHDGVVVRDLGGALRIDGASALLIATPHEALAERAGSTGVEVSGLAVDADRIALLRDGRVVGWFPVQADGSFAAVIPADVEQLRAEAAGRNHSAAVAPGTDLDLRIGAEGAVEIRPAWSTDQQRPLRVAWTSLNGRSGVGFLPAQGGTLFLGFGQYELTVSAGPAFWPAVVEAEPDGVSSDQVTVRLEERFDPGSRVLAGLGWPSDRARSWRGTDTRAAQEAHSLGAEWVVFTPEDDVAQVSDDDPAFPRVVHDNGSLALARDGSWSVWSWPWTPARQRPGGGAIDTRGLDAQDALAAAVGGLTRDRHTVVDLGWLDAAPSPWAVHPAPEGVRLDAPGSAGPAAWASWFRWLDAGAPLTPVGPWTWMEVPDRDEPTRADLVQSFTAGTTVATTGPLIALSVDGAAPGRIPPGDPTLSALGEVWIGGALDLDRAALIGEGGAILREWDLAGAPDRWHTTAVVPPGRWVIAAAWSDDGEAFAATAPVWRSPP